MVYHLLLLPPLDILKMIFCLCCRSEILRMFNITRKGRRLIHVTCELEIVKFGIVSKLERPQPAAAVRTTYWPAGSPVMPPSGLPHAE
ncbi:hypothetical protein MKX03_015361, partial [Papaver bracteatum]